MNEINRPKPIRSIPTNAKEVYKGKIFTLYQWQQEMFDGSTSTFEMLKRPDTVMIIPVTEDNRIILTRQEQPGHHFTGLAGGRLDRNETIIEAAQRELLEETGLKASTFELLNSFQPAGEKIDWFVFTLIARNCKKVQDQNLDSGEKVEIIEVDFEEFIEICLQEDFRDNELQMLILKHYYEFKDFSRLKKRILNPF
ncbi:MAG TPA: NUDIX hydrolase [Candidatus Dojkabacteria bacterium]|jgi:8-oxo-dGTP pyrophosphatase MutT (NUDIX family)|nr:NUDIX hydrolase [Candidatus Dojkabacteria bacterium]